MCYSIYVATTSSRDLAAHVGTRIQFERDLWTPEPAALELLIYPNRWFLTREFGGCSCHFRHVAEINDPLFEPYAEWQATDPDDLEATWEAFEVFRSLVEAGEGLEVMNLWEDPSPDEVKSFDVNLSKIPPNAFQFVENVRLHFRPAS